MSLKGLIGSKQGAGARAAIFSILSKKMVFGTKNYVFLIRYGAGREKAHDRNYEFIKSITI